MFESVLGWLKHAGIMVFVQSLRFVSQNICVCFTKRERERGSSGSSLGDFALKYSWILQQC